ncbi:AraC family transcriptional regulator [Auritidibacter ignavus]|uniref:helix-turn-helix transcriptional regulator n=1 Tax=Auritidibacter ignavus TaxID=678932 RepID=UPI00244BC9B2|nr:AraC family transcriptional regulator [Auritidibacter ignavus]WGH81971.1 AraC family transcriptional regulator [Auritidibacter ignavus]WGH88866.1 AraC family transcriptional regulator [Auritidibacter ignavus]WGH91169.1 AraC family transcriptional regulator [Auritidibacter ignavus]WHS34984.1 AraC family transcriptional regulator [Auritidibacter ignavus]
MTLLDSSSTGEDIDDPVGFPVRERIVPDGYLLTTRFLRYAYVDDADGCSPDEHAHPEHVVFWPERAAAEVEVEGTRHNLTLGQGLWVPAGTRHAASRAPSTTLAALHLLPEAWEGPAPEVHPVTVNAALRALLSHLAITGMPRQQRLRAQQVCLELVTDDACPVIELPLPRDPRIAPIARAIMSDPADDRSIEHWAWATSTSARTLARAFRAETGMTFSQWRTAARMSAAVRLLSDGTPVGIVARRVGYATISAFSAAFHRVMGRPPHRFLPANNDD